MTREEVFAAVAGRVSFLGAATATDGDGWIDCAELVADAATLATIVRNTKPGFETDDDSVAASLFVEAYAFRVAGTALAAYALDLPVPGLAPAAVALRVDKPRPSAVAYLDPRMYAADAGDLAETLIGAHVAPFVAAVHRAFPVGERLLWGNVAAACAVALRAVESSGATDEDRDRVRDRAAAFVVACGPWYDDVGRFTVVELAGRQGWYWDRTSCCLWFRTTNGQLCDNCSLIDATELHRRRVRELLGGDGLP